MRRILLCLSLLALSLNAALAARPDVPIDHIIVIFMENHSFDNLYSQFPGANGLQKPEAEIPQVDLWGGKLGILPQPLFSIYAVEEIASAGARKRAVSVDPRFPANLPNHTFEIDRYATNAAHLPDMVHRYYQYQLQINGGRMDKFVAWTDAGGMTMGVFDTAKLPLYPYAKQFTLCDNMFSSFLGGSFPNHFWLISARAPLWPNAPASMVAKPVFDSAGNLVALDRDGEVTHDGFVINDVEPLEIPHANIPADQRCPLQDFATIGDRLSAADVSWAWYGGGWDDAVAGHPDPTFQNDHQPFNYFKQFRVGTAARKAHLKDEKDFDRALAEGTLPAVSFIKPLGIVDEHPAYSTVYEAELHAVDILKRVQASKYWPRCAVIVTYDDFGGWYDHVPPKILDRFGPGSRIPMIVVSPWARKGFVDHTLYETSSVTKFLEWRFDVAPLAERDARANNILPAFDFKGTIR